MCSALVCRDMSPTDDVSFRLRLRAVVTQPRYKSIGRRWVGSGSPPDPGQSIFERFAATSAGAKRPSVSSLRCLDQAENDRDLPAAADTTAAGGGVAVVLRSLLISSSNDGGDEDVRGGAINRICVWMNAVAKRFTDQHPAAAAAAAAAAAEAFSRTSRRRSCTLPRIKQ